MKITFVIGSYNPSGGNRVIAVYADRLQRRGHDVTVVGPFDPAPTIKQRIRSLLEGRVWSPARPPFNLYHFDGLDNVSRQVLDSYRPVTASDLPDADVVIATWWGTAPWVHALPPSKGAHVYFIQHHEGDPLFSHQYAHKAQATYRLPFSKIVIARWLQNLMRDPYGDPNAILVPNSVDTQLFHAPPRAKQPRPTVGVMYSDVSFKGFDISLKTLKILAQQLPELRVVSFGSTLPTADLPLPPGTTFEHLPPQDQIRGLYSQCDAWFSSSVIEGFSLPLLEAMACRCPVVATRCGGPEDFVVDGVNGYLVPVGDSAAIADRLHHILTRPEPEWRQFSEAAYQTATSYTWDDATDRFEAALKTAAAQAQAPHA